MQSLSLLPSGLAAQPRRGQRLIVVAQGRSASGEDQGRRVAAVALIAGMVGVLAPSAALAKKSKSSPSIASASGYAATGVKKLGSSAEARKAARKGVPGFEEKE